MENKINKLHAHFDKCKQCRENPFFLCPKGKALLDAIDVNELANELQEMFNKKEEQR